MRRPSTSERDGGSSRPLRLQDGRRTGEHRGRADLSLTTPPATRTEQTILSEFLDSLGPVDRSVLVLYMEGLSNGDIATVAGISAGAVAVRINRMKQKFETTYVER